MRTLSLRKGNNLIPQIAGGLQTLIIARNVRRLNLDVHVKGKSLLDYTISKINRSNPGPTK